ncbi:hypothetical protein GYMLUDRAFT_201191 [Collybiopsis luxurians FD-317 M1]|uniref:Unplaced genomic scaffold GYMLUscaffold_30, whole genome shotgun sequence n=1 Tax=Collybiopsis luxurians FD-317 M1 TaxID=944289 RepID=A0A0D0B864_9AGAR|nr:hypothetical protein GYMLUDRAFT_201191 [Collybiopsis luxurians FD-317 M1]
MIDSSSQAYKKARRQYLKSTKNRDPNIEKDWTPFRTAEKHFKARFPPPDLTKVLDLATLDDSRALEVAAGVWTGKADAIETRELSTRSGSKAYAFPSVPGRLILLPAFLSPEKQRDLIKWSLVEHSQPPNETNLDIHYLLPDEGIWNAHLRDGAALVYPRPIEANADYTKQEPGPRQLINNTPATTNNFESLTNISKPPLPPSATTLPSTCRDLLPRLRWTNIGWFYHWGLKQYDFSKGKIPVHDTIREVCKGAVRSIDWRDIFASDTSDWGSSGPDWMDWHESYEPDAGIVNFYQTKDTLMAHVDRSEVCSTSPLCSISLGNAAIFLIGGPTRETEPVPLLLRSGDVVMMSGPACRRSYHGVPRILENTLPFHMKDVVDPEWAPFKSYMDSTRININVRQVFPKGFDPGLS